MALKTCESCGGTGEAFSKEQNDWEHPITLCKECNGVGMTGVCNHGYDYTDCALCLNPPPVSCTKLDPDDPCVPGYGGKCVNCGYEVMTEVDDNGIPKLD